MASQNKKRAPKGFGAFKPIQVGIFTLTQYNSLLQREMEFFTSIQERNMRAILPIFQLTKQVAEDLKIDTESAFAKVNSFANTKTPSTEDTELMLRYLDKIQEIQNSLLNESKLQNEMVSIVLQSRVSSKWLRENADYLLEIFDINVFDSQEDDSDPLQWIPEFTSKLPVSVVQAVMRFIESEKSGNIEEDTGEEEEPMASPEALGKQS